MSIKFLVLGGGILGFSFGGGSADFIFMGARIFLVLCGPMGTDLSILLPWEFPSYSGKCKVLIFLKV